MAFGTTTILKPVKPFFRLRIECRFLHQYFAVVAPVALDYERVTGESAAACQASGVAPIGTPMRSCQLREGCSASMWSCP